MVAGHQGANSSQALLIDVSESGAQIQTGSNSPSGSTISLTWSVIPGTSPIEVRAKVIWSRRHLMGLQFENLSPKVLSILRAVVRVHRA
jgi:hypothetical protein